MHRNSIGKRERIKAMKTVFLLEGQQHDVAPDAIAPL